MDGSGWNVMGRGRPLRPRGRGAGFFGGYGNRAKQPAKQPKQPVKRQRVSTDSTGSATGASKNDMPKLTVDQFKSLNVDGKLENIFLCLQGIMSTHERLLKAEQTVFEMRKTGQVNKSRIDLLAYKSIDNESRQRRNNLIFYGIPENLSEDSTAVLSSFLVDHLSIDSDAIFVQRAHRLGRLKSHRPGPSVQVKHRPLIANFRDNPDVELILANAKKLKGTQYGINRDYPNELVQARKPLFKQKKELQSANPLSNVSIQYPAKLVMDRKVVTDMFPDWANAMKLNRLDTCQYSQFENFDVFDDDSSTDNPDIEPRPPAAPASPPMSQSLLSNHGAMPPRHISHDIGMVSPTSGGATRVVPPSTPTSENAGSVG